MMENRRLLVVDDSPTVRKLVELSFRGTPWTIETASTGSDALLSAKRTHPDAILLDFVLPDMRGVDVCERLSKDDSTASIPIVVMSGKESAADIFRAYGAVFACLPKPSTSEQIRAQVEAATARRAPSKARDTNRSSFAQKEAAAKAVYAVLRDAFATIPQWMNELGDNSPAKFFARKVLTPQLTGALLDALVPHVRDRAPEATTPSAVPSHEDLPTDMSFRATTQGWPVAAFITFFESSARTGTLTIAWNNNETIVYMRGGEIIAVTNRNPFEYLRGLSWARQKAVPADAMQTAAAEQRQSGTPVPFTLAANGLFPANTLADALASQGRRLLMAAMAVESATLTWRDLAALPAYVEAHGRHISSARNTLPFGVETPAAVSASQRILEELRESPPRRVIEKSAVLSRARGFSDLVQRFSLTAIERQVLTVVDGRHTSEELANWTGLQLSEILPVLARLLEVQLLADGALATPTHPCSAQAPRPVMIVDEDVDGFRDPLASLLKSRSAPIALVDIAKDQDLLAAIQREHPQALFLNAAAAPILDILRAVRAQPALADVRLVAVLEPEMAAQAADLSAAHFDAVLVKPVARAEIERLLG